MAQATEAIEAVIISGPKRGQIVQLPEQSLRDPSDDEIQELNDCLDELIAALDRLSSEIRATTAALNEKAEAV